ARGARHPLRQTPRLRTRTRAFSRPGARGRTCNAPRGIEVPLTPGDNGVMQRNTRQRTAILETLSRQADFRSAQQIHEQMRADGETEGLATVYSNPQALSPAGRPDEIVAADGESLYREGGDPGPH